ncbi:hypothetical protein ACP0HM_30095 [Escherichia coli]
MIPTLIRRCWTSVIPGNDDAIRAVTLYLGALLLQTVREGRSRDLASCAEESFVEAE